MPTHNLKNQSKSFSGLILLASLLIFLPACSKNTVKSEEPKETVLNAESTAQAVSAPAAAGVSNPAPVVVLDSAAVTSAPSTSASTGTTTVQASEAVSTTAASPTSITPTVSQDSTVGSPASQLVNPSPALAGAVSENSAIPEAASSSTTETAASPASILAETAPAPKPAAAVVRKHSARKKITAPASSAPVKIVSAPPKDMKSPFNTWKPSEKEKVDPTQALPVVSSNVPKLVTTEPAKIPEPAKNTGDNSDWVWGVVLLASAGLGWLYLAKGQGNSSHKIQPLPPTGGLSPVSGYMLQKENKETEPRPKTSFWRKKIF
jgi:hypothetical protein